MQKAGKTHRKKPSSGRMLPLPCRVFSQMLKHRTSVRPEKTYAAFGRYTCLPEQINVCINTCIFADVFLASPGERLKVQWPFGEHSREEVQEALAKRLLVLKEAGGDTLVG